jgi:hypothetical protein
MPRKTGKLSKVEEFYIANNTHLGLKQIAEDLNRTQEAIKSVYHDNTEEEPQKKEKAVGDITDKFARREGRGVTMMTPTASDAADSSRKSRLDKGSRYSDSIHIIKPE